MRRSGRVIDVGRIESVCALNSYKHSGRDYGFDNAKSLADNMQERAASCGLWYMPSFCNHSCLPTASHNIYGDVFVVHAVVDLKKGDEVTLPTWTL
ncbi:hypothetical protein AAVH_24498 [Aphelenchoides avenae]|nr:hypothetical protein AAVH_24498 [Aphelenchus avenae]